MRAMAGRVVAGRPRSAIGMPPRPRRPRVALAEAFPATVGLRRTFRTWMPGGPAEVDLARRDGRDGIGDDRDRRPGGRDDEGGAHRMSSALDSRVARAMPVSTGWAGSKRSPPRAGIDRFPLGGGAGRCAGRSFVLRAAKRNGPAHRSMPPRGTGGRLAGRGRDRGPAPGTTDAPTRTPWTSAPAAARPPIVPAAHRPPHRSRRRARPASRPAEGLVARGVDETHARVLREAVRREKPADPSPRGSRMPQRPARTGRADPRGPRGPGRMAGDGGARGDGPGGASTLLGPRATLGLTCPDGGGGRSAWCPRT